MFGTLFGAEMPLAVRFFLAFLVVLGLIGAAAWAVRRFGSGRLGSASTRGRQPRLAVIDYASVDARRRLILVRRDNVEHLLMIGGPTDIVVEPNIVRAVAATRDATATRTPAIETLPRATLPETGSNGSWPLQPEPTLTPQRPTPRIESPTDEPATWPLQPQTEPAPRPQRDTLSALADELSNRQNSSRNRIPSGPRPNPAEARPAERSAEPRVEPHSALARSTADEAGSADQNLAEMAQRLEAALRNSNANSMTDSRDVRTPNVRASAAAEQTSQAEVAPPSPSQRIARAAEPKMPRGDTPPANQSKSVYDSLEQEMASLLGRPTNKT